MQRGQVFRIDRFKKRSFEKVGAFDGIEIDHGDKKRGQDKQDSKVPYRNASAIRKQIKEAGDADDHAEKPAAAIVKDNDRNISDDKPDS